jgi:hypothetical protein
MAKKQPREEKPPADSNRDERQEKQRVIVVWNYSRLVGRKKKQIDENGNETEEEVEVQLPFISRVRLSTVKKFGLEPLLKAPILEDKKGNVRFLRGSKGAKSYILKTQDNGKINSYSFPVPAYTRVVDFIEGLLSSIPSNLRPISIVTPDGVTFGGEFLRDTIAELEPTDDIVEEVPEQINEPSNPDD